MGSETPKPTSDQAGMRMLSDKNERFFETLRDLPPQAQEFLTGLSSQFMEPDVYRKFKARKRKIVGLERELRRMELDDDKIREVMDFFNLPFAKK